MAEETNPQPNNQQPASAQSAEEQLEELRKQKDEYLAGWQRAKADFLNYKKDEGERLKQLALFIEAEMVLRLLPLLDNFATAEKSLAEDLKNNDYVKGLLQVKTQLENFLKALGVEPIEALGKKFDPQFHEVALEVEDKDKEPGTVVEEIQKGYLAGDRLLRPAKVKIIKTIHSNASGETPVKPNP